MNSPMNLKNAKKIAQDGKSSTFMLEGGHKLTVQHDNLSALHKKQIKKLPLYAAHGLDDVDDDSPEDFKPGKDYSNTPLPGDANSTSAPAAPPVEENPYTDPMGG